MFIYLFAYFSFIGFYLFSNLSLSFFLIFLHFFVEIIGFGERVERPPDLKNLVGHLEKRKAFTLDENVRKTQRKEEINAKRQKKLDLREINKDDVAGENDGFGTEMDESQLSLKLSGAQKRQNRAKLGKFIEQ